MGGHGATFSGMFYFLFASITVLFEELSELSLSELSCMFRFDKSSFRFLMIVSSSFESHRSHVELNICLDLGS